MAQQTNYTLIVKTREGAEPEHYPLRVRTDKAAQREARQMARRFPGAHVFCEFFCPSDGQKGYLNPDGSADITGQAYIKTKGDA